jgi:GNAT superfamily N-acetyltransferase
MTQLLDLPNGYYELPKGRLANVVTCLEMLAKPAATSGALPEGLSLRRFGAQDLAAFRGLFRAIGEDLLWFSRLIMPDENLAAILGDPQVESYALMQDGEALGLLELDFRESPQCELSFFGLRKEAIGAGLGRTLMNLAIHKAWQNPITRFWVHTCHYDHPNALGFYKRSGFTPYALMVEVHDDPRLHGKLPETASPHVALLKP